MTISSSPHRCQLLAVLALSLSVVAPGCHAIDFYEPSLLAPVPRAFEPPRELSKMSLPLYRIEPPERLVDRGSQTGAAAAVSD